MRSRTIVLFWGATAAATAFLGSAWASAGRLSGGDPAGPAVFVLSVVGLLASVFVAGRIALVVARLQRRARRPSDPPARS